MRKISEMRNLGPTSEEDFNAVDIHYAYQIKKLGHLKAFEKMMFGRAIMGKSTSCVNALYLYAVYGAIHDIDWRNIPEKKKEEFKKHTKKLRKSKKFES